MKLNRYRPDRRGFTLMEMTIALVVAFIVVLGVGQMMVINQKMWKTAADKALLQQNVSEVLEGIASTVRSSSSLEIMAADQFRTWDQSRASSHTFALTEGPEGGWLRKDGQLISPRNCVRFECAANADGSSLDLLLELEDSSGNRITGMTQITIRSATLAF